MNIVPLGMEKLAYMCPACGNYYLESGICSYSVFHVVRYSDGSCVSEYQPTFVTKCPRCGSFFAKEHLFPLPCRCYPSGQGRNCRGRALGGTEVSYGRLDDFFESREEQIAFWEEAVAHGLYFPVTVCEAIRRQMTVAMYKELWYQYNRAKNRCEDSVYSAHCQRLIALLDESALAC